MDIKNIISAMTLEEKAGLLSGNDYWRTKAVERLLVPHIKLSDGPHGLRMQKDGMEAVNVNDVIKAVCFPAGCATASSFSRETLVKLGETLGEECQAENVAVLLGPAVNIKRSPLCGRNFEYFSEDPYLAGEIAKGHIKGVQSKNVGTSIKHFLANSQEKRRLTSSSGIDERTLREIYLPAFETAVKEQQPWTVMCCYNKVNGVYGSENRRFLTDILRKEWGFEGFVMSDWGAVSNRPLGVWAGLDLEMPATRGHINDKKIVEAVKEGRLSEGDVDKACERILKIVERFTENRIEGCEFDLDKHHEIAREIAEECVVLLKNEGGVLPLEKGEKIAVIGGFAKNPRYQGGGSSHINCHKVESAWDYFCENKNVTFTLGFDVEQSDADDTLINEAVEAAKKAGKAVIFAGLPESYESEGFDRTHMRLPDCQNELIRRVCEICDKVVVVLHNGSPVEMPWVNDVQGIVEAYLGGQAIGGAVVKVLYGDVNPSGRLAETFPLKLEDNPSYLYYFGERDVTEYREGVFVGYRYYDKKKMEVLFPFGHGLSYTEFEYSNLTLSKTEMSDIETLEVTVDVKNIGNVFGKEVVQLYVAPKTEGVIRPVRELKGFEKIALEPNETKTVKFSLSKRDFSYFNTEINDWHAVTGDYGIEVAKSSRSIQLSVDVRLNSTTVIKRKYDLDTTVGDLLSSDRTRAVFAPYMDMYSSAENTFDAENNTLGASTLQMLIAINECMPLRNGMSYGTDKADYDRIMELIEKLNSMNDFN